MLKNMEEFVSIKSILCFLKRKIKVIVCFTIIALVFGAGYALTIKEKNNNISNIETETLNKEMKYYKNITIFTDVKEYIPTEENTSYQAELNKVVAIFKSQDILIKLFNEIDESKIPNVPEESSSGSLFDYFRSLFVQDSISNTGMSLSIYSIDEETADYIAEKYFEIFEQMVTETVVDYKYKIISEYGYYFGEAATSLSEYKLDKVEYRAKINETTSNVIKFGTIGVAIGFLGAVFILLLFYFMSDAVRSKYTIVKNMYLAIIGEISKKGLKKQSSIDEYLFNELENICLKYKMICFVCLEKPKYLISTLTKYVKNNPDKKKLLINLNSKNSQTDNDYICNYDSLDTHNYINLEKIDEDVNSNDNVFICFNVNEHLMDLNKIVKKSDCVIIQITEDKTSKNNLVNIVLNFEKNNCDIYGAVYINE